MFACLKGGAGLQSIDLLKSIDEAAATAAESALVHQRPSKACYATAEGAYVMAPWGTKRGWAMGGGGPGRGTWRHGGAAAVPKINSGRGH